MVKQGRSQPPREGMWLGTQWALNNYSVWIKERRAQLPTCQMCAVRPERRRPVSGHPAGGGGARTPPLPLSHRPLVPPPCLQTCPVRILETTALCLPTGSREPIAAS